MKLCSSVKLAGNAMRPAFRRLSHSSWCLTQMQKIVSWDFVSKLISYIEEHPATGTAILWDSKAKRKEWLRTLYQVCTVLRCSFLELVQACFTGALLKYENGICRKNKKYKDAKGLWSDSVSFQRKKKVRTVSQVKFWLVQSQWELNQRPGFQTVISPQRLAQSGIGFIQWSDFIPGDWVVFGENTRMNVPLNEYTKYTK